MYKQVYLILHLLLILLLIMQFLYFLVVFRRREAECSQNQNLVMQLPQLSLVTTTYLATEYQGIC